MRGIIAVVLAALAVLYSLIVLLSADRTANRGWPPARKKSQIPGRVSWKRYCYTGRGARQIIGVTETHPS